MANLVLRPNDGGFYSGWTPSPGAVPRWQNIDDVDSDGDSTYLSTDVEDDVFTVGFSDIAPIAYPRPIRIPSITVATTIRGFSVTPTTFKFRLRYLDENYDSEEFTIASDTYVVRTKTYNYLPNDFLPAGVPWNAVRVNDLEVGLVYISGVELLCSKMEIQVHTELFPHWTLSPNGDGFHNTGWEATPGVGPKVDHLQPQYDGDKSYLSDDTDTNIYTVTLTDLGPAPTPPNIDRVTASALIKNIDDTTPSNVSLVVRSGGTDRVGATSTDGWDLAPLSEWTPITETWLTEPSSGFPSGLPAASSWAKADIDSLEIGFQTNVTGPTLRATSLSAEVWLKDTPINTFETYPTSDGFHTDLATLAPAGGEDPWEDVDEVVPDDATSYIGADADSSGSAMFGSFGVGAVGPIAAGERIHCVEVRLRVRLGSSSEAVICPLIRSGGETYLGRPIRIEGTGTTWFDVWEDFYTDPNTGDPWELANVNAAQYGMAILSGGMFLSRVRAQVQTAPDIRGSSSARDIAITDGVAPSGTTIMTRSIGDGTIYAILEFGIGQAGFDPTDPKTALSVTSSDSSLGAEIERYPITAVTFDSTSIPQKVQYWCRVPKGLPLDCVGEVGLYATFLYSPNPAEIGTDFLFAKMHIPAQCRHTNAVQLFVIEIEYP